MPKFRTMMTSAPIVATDKLRNPTELVTPFGSFLRKSSLDELPQIYSILAGHMNFVGPRPALYNQFDLIELRKLFLVDQIRPGLTGLAQISGRDDLSIEEKVNADAIYLKKRTTSYDLLIILKTFKKVFSSEGIRH
jgi:O-antigen biosynthesis protein WbqP